VQQEAERAAGWGRRLASRGGIQGRWARRFAGGRWRRRRRRDLRSGELRPDCRQHDHGDPEASRANWRSPADIKEVHRNASFLKNKRVVFNVGGNKYRLVIVVLYRAQMILVRFVGTHAQYDTIDAEEV
jgi:mRNA interferase HigB